MDPNFPFCHLCYNEWKVKVISRDDHLLLTRGVEQRAGPRGILCIPILEKIRLVLSEGLFCPHGAFCHLSYREREDSSPPREPSWPPGFLFSLKIALSLSQGPPSLVKLFTTLAFMSE